MRLVLVCGGGVASDALGVIDAINDVHHSIDVAGFVSDGDFGVIHGHKQIGNIEDIGRLDVSHYLVCLGYPEKKKSVIDRIRDIGGVVPAPALIHPRAWVPKGTEIGDGSLVLAGVCFSRGVRVGRHVYISHGALVGHEAVIADYVSLMPGASVSGDTVLFEGCMIGSNATVLEKISPLEN